VIRSLFSSDMDHPVTAPFRRYFGQIRFLPRNFSRLVKLALPTAACPAVVAACRATWLDAAVWPDAYRQRYERQLEDHADCAGQICLDRLILMPTWASQIVP
jgi:hypothetical protein